MRKAEVWAPNAHSVRLLTPSRVVEMERDPEGWFRAVVDLRAGDDYGFSLDDSEPLPDPRSAWQPNGVFGPSRAVDHDAFAWTDASWAGLELASAVIYELHVGTFSPSGTFAGAIEKLDALVALGINAIEVMPIAAFDGEYGWGYDGVALYAVHEPYGGPDGFKQLVNAAHARGLGVVLDVVYNHFGPTGNHLAQFGPYTTDRHLTPWGESLNLDGDDSGPVRQFIVENASHWFERFHVDGLRLDAVHALVDESDPHLLAELATAVDTIAARRGRPAWLIAEYPRTDTRAVTDRDAGGHGLDAVWRDEVHHSLHAWLTGERVGYYADYGSAAEIAAALVGPDANLARNHFVVCAQNHDQVGNRAIGERLNHLVDGGLAKAAAALVLCGPFVPLLFMGEEWAATTPFPYFAAPRHAELDRTLRTGRVEEFRAFGWNADDLPDPTSSATLESARLRWDEVDESPHKEMLAWYRDLIRLRAARPELRDPRPKSIAVDEHETDDVIVVWREATAIAVNKGRESARVLLDCCAADRRILMASDDNITLIDGGVHLPPHSVAIVGS